MFNQSFPTKRVRKIRKCQEHPLVASPGEYDGFLAAAFSLGVVVYV
jgi:hypothetical protein